LLEVPILIFPEVFDEITTSSVGTLLFKAPSEKEVRNFVENDPYYTNGLVTSNLIYLLNIVEWTVKEWNVVIGLESILNKK
jgi:hypothetical protein